MTKSNQFTPENPSIMDRLKELFRQGNVRHVVMKNETRQLVDLPLNIVLLGTLLAPWLVGIGIVIALVKGYRLELTNPEKHDTSGAAPLSDSPHGTTGPATPEDGSQSTATGLGDENPPASAAESAGDV